MRWPCTTSLRVMTYNVFAGPPTPTKLAGTLDGSERLKQQVAEIRRLQPDIVCLQEVLLDGVRSFYESSLGDEYAASFVLTEHELRCRVGKMMRRALDHVGPQTTMCRRTRGHRIPGPESRAWPMLLIFVRTAVPCARV